MILHVPFGKFKHNDNRCHNYCSICTDQLDHSFKFTNTGEIREGTINYTCMDMHIYELEYDGVFILVFGPAYNFDQISFRHPETEKILLVC